MIKMIDFFCLDICHTSKQIYFYGAFFLHLRYCKEQVLNFHFQQHHVRLIFASRLFRKTFRKAPKVFENLFMI